MAEGVELLQGPQFKPKQIKTKLPVFIEKNCSFLADVVFLVVMYVYI
jgi:hypothetical protein